MRNEPSDVTCFCFVLRLTFWRRDFNVKVFLNILTIAIFGNDIAFVSMHYLKGRKKNFNI